MRPILFSVIPRYVGIYVDPAQTRAKPGVTIMSPKAATKTSPRKPVAITEECGTQEMPAVG